MIICMVVIIWAISLRNSSMQIFRELIEIFSFRQKRRHRLSPKSIFSTISVTESVPLPNFAQTMPDIYIYMYNVEK